MRAPVETRGRILSIYMMALGLVYPVGAVIQGWLADTLGIRAVTVWGALILLGLLALVAFVRPSVFTNLADPPSLDGSAADAIEGLGTTDSAPAGGIG